MKTVAFILPSLAGGGAERVMLTLMSGLDRDRCHGALLLLSDEGPLATLIAAGTTVRNLETPRLRHALPKLFASIRQLNPSAVVSTLGYVSLALLAFRRRLPRDARIIVREANLPSLSLPNAPYSTLTRLAYRFLYRRADAVLCTSEIMLDEFRDDYRVPAERLHLLPNPVDEAAIRAAAREPMRAPGAGPRFIAAGRLTRQKGFDRLIEAMAATHADARLTIFGEGPERAGLESEIDRLGLVGRVTLPGFEPAPWPWYAGADALLLPSRWEGMPNVALEALACGTPVIATPEAGGIAELAEAAPPGAVTVIETGAPFLGAMSGVRPKQTASMGPSLLPGHHRLPAVIERFTEILEELD